ncbi:HEPN domain-containing protein [Acidithiobacillus acidisediminis]|uniref:HEPN domain-containing protein n=1 Tax=Acidithiobacillus acidisediminis TaxID=2937799 RepID=UPI00200F553B|nr:HEPN domain-containing protein [Acidithiobacillus sp. S30A2]
MKSLSNELMSKADVAFKSAITLYNAEDYNGSVNRAYYAMLDAAKAALIHQRVQGAENIRSHSGLISEFSRHFVKTGKVGVEMSKILTRAESARLVADYSYDSLDKVGAHEHIASAGRFISEIKRKIIKNIEIE